MAWEMPSSFTRTFKLSISHQVIFKTIGLTITRTNVKQNLWFLHAKDNIRHK